MKVAEIDNSLDAQNVILWQYDNAAKFCKVVKLIEDRGKSATEEFWNGFKDKVHGLFALPDEEVTDDDEVIGYALSLWGTRVGMQRPMLPMETD